MSGKAKQNDEFSDILECIATTQEMLLIDGALIGDFNAPFTKLLMTKHGYSDKVETDVTSKGEAVVLRHYTGSGYRDLKEPLLNDKTGLIEIDLKEIPNE